MAKRTWSSRKQKQSVDNFMVYLLVVSVLNNRVSQIIKNIEQQYVAQKIKMKKFLLPFIDKSFSFSPKKPFQILAERRVPRRKLTSSNLHFPNWRRGGDSNSRYPFGYSGFQDRCIRPLF